MSHRLTSLVSLRTATVEAFELSGKGNAGIHETNEDEDIWLSADRMNKLDDEIFWNTVCVD